MRGRAASVVDRVVVATARELSRVGYAAMRVEDVASRSGVHKTTIYRRWPTKEELVAATITTMIAKSDAGIAIDTGTVRGDLHASMLRVLDLSPTELGVLRIMQVERGIPEVNSMAQRFRAAVHRLRVAMVERGIARGELPAGVDANLIVDLISAPLQSALLFDDSLDTSYLDRVLDVVLMGAAACATEPAPKRAPKRAARASKSTRARARAR